MIVELVASTMVTFAEVEVRVVLELTEETVLVIPVTRPEISEAAWVCRSGFPSILSKVAGIDYD